SLPHQVVDTRSGPVGVAMPPQGWGLGSDPSLPVYQPQRPRDVAAPPQPRFGTELKTELVPPKPRRRWPVVVAVATVLSIAGVALAIAWSNEAPQPAAVQPPVEAKPAPPPPTPPAPPPV